MLRTGVSNKRSAFDGERPVLRFECSALRNEIRNDSGPASNIAVTCSIRVLAMIKLLSAFLLYAHSFATDSFLSDNLLRNHQVQNVLEHQPAKAPACQHTVRSPLCLLVHLLNLPILSQQVL
jgi:hypothetical protein